MKIMDAAQIALDRAAAKYRRVYNRAYNLSEQGEYDRAYRMLAKANSEYAAAKLSFENITGRKAS